MKRVLLVAALSASIALLVTAIAIWAFPPAYVKGQASPAGTEFLNGAFEGEYQPWEGAETRRIAPSWSLWYVDSWPGENSIAPPHASDTQDSQHVRSGKAQGLHTDGPYQNFAACLYQQITDLTPGHVLSFSAWAKVEADQDLRTADNMQTWLGIDFNGSTDPRDINYYTHPNNWSTYTNYGEWQQLSVEWYTTSSTATLYLCAHPKYPLEFHVYWDDASFTATPGSLVYLPVLRRDPCQIERRTLGNPDMEESFCEIEGYQPYPGYENIFVAPWWTPFWNHDFDPSTGENRQPEFGPTDRSYRLYSGAVSQQIGISGGGAFEAGVYQIVQGTFPGEVMRFRMWGQGWNQYWPNVNSVDERVSDYQEKDGLRFRIGIDPYGGEDYTSPNIVWSEMQDPYDAWHQFEVIATAQAYQVSVWLYAHPSQWQMRWNESFWDGGEFEILAKPGVQFDPETYTVVESAGAVTLTVSLDAPFVVPVEVDYATGDQGAQSPDDYASSSGTLTFAPGTTIQTVEVSIADDMLDEEAETLSVTLSNAKNAVIKGANPAVVTIEDDDEPTPP